MIFADLHEDGRYLYPGTGAARKPAGARRGHEAQSAAGAGGRRCRLRRRSGRRCIAHLERFEPEFIILQCGADSLEGDPITHLRFSPHRTAVRRASWRRSPTGSATGGCWRSAAAATTAPTSRRPGPRWSKTCCRRCRGAGPVADLRGGVRHKARGVPVQSAPPSLRTQRLRACSRKTMTIAGFDPELAKAHRRASAAARKTTSSSSPPRTTPARACSRRRARCSPTSTPKAIRASATTAAASTSTSPSSSPSIARRQLFGADYANVQPHSGSQANAAAYLALVQPGDTDPRHEPRSRRPPDARRQGELLRQALQAPPSTASGRTTARSTTTQVQRLAEEHKPKMIVAGFSAYSRVIDWARFARDRRRASAPTSSSTWRTSPGLVATGLYPNPVPHADVVTTTTHKTLRGPRGGLILARANDEITRSSTRWCFPGTQGGPLMHVIAAKAVAFLEALQPEFKDYQRQVLANARAMAATLRRARLPDRLGRHRQPPVPGEPRRPQHHRQGCGRGARQRATSPSTRTPCRTTRARR